MDFEPSNLPHEYPNLAAGRTGLEADDEAEIRYSLTALGEALLVERAGSRFRGFGPCPAASLAAAR